MRIASLKKKYTEFFDSVEQSVKEDIVNIIGTDKQFLKYCDNPNMRKKLDAIAYNSAVYAMLEHHKIIKTD